jgi:hypothetical protein
MAKRPQKRHTNTLQKRSNDSVPQWLLDKVAALCGGISIVAFILFLYSLTGIDDSETLSGIFRWFLLGAALLFLLLTIVCHKELSKELEDEKSKTSYVISPIILDTLKNSGIPNDIIDCFKILWPRLRQRGFTPKITSQITKLGNDETWLEKLELKLGRVRIDEFREIILKYTRRID